eukprot:augustus_masked-scaffold_3-processed-gene-3.70-mRNA-1 protein AED:0.20 eAED:0.20 QI:0/-1/0/1/-1/1/1/0/307
MKPFRPPSIKLGKVSQLYKWNESLPIQTPAYFSSTNDLPMQQTISYFDKESPQTLDLMKDSCKRAAELLNYACSLVSPGVTTEEIDLKCFKYCVEELKVYPSPHRYNNFPKSIATSINDVLCHGIPDDRELQFGDIINLDISTFLNGYHGDTSRNLFVGAEGDLDKEEFETQKKLLDSCKTALDKSIEKIGPGVDLKAVCTICDEVAEENGFKINETFVGHGIGQAFHMQPYVRSTWSSMPDYEKKLDMKLVPGMVFTIEPIFCEIDTKYEILEDGWTVKSTSGSLSTQFEHTVLITDNGTEVLTQV